MHVQSRNCIDVWNTAEYVPGICLNVITVDSQTCSQPYSRHRHNPKPVLVWAAQTSDKYILAHHCCIRSRMWLYTSCTVFIGMGAIKWFPIGGRPMNWSITSLSENVGSVLHVCTTDIFEIQLSLFGCKRKRVGKTLNNVTHTHRNRNTDTWTVIIVQSNLDKWDTLRRAPTVPLIEVSHLARSHLSRFRISL